MFGSFVARLALGGETADASQMSNSFLIKTMPQFGKPSATGLKRGEAV